MEENRTGSITEQLQGQAGQLQALIDQQKRLTYTDPSKISDADALGILISNWVWHNWDTWGQDTWGTDTILKAAGAALEDCNYHSAAATVRGLVKS